MRKIKHIVVHHTGGHWGSADDIIKWHTDPKPPKGKGNGWSKPGYHYVVNNGFPTYRSHYLDKKVKGWEGRIESVDHGLVKIEQTSNGVLAFNQNLINICLVGNFDINIPSETQLNALEVLCMGLLQKYDLDIKNIIGHREAIKIRERKEKKRRRDHNKTCPGMNINMNDLRERIKESIIENDYFFLDN